jgi:hypothetical protein
MKIEFTEERTVRRPDGTGTKYEAGKVYDLPDASAEHFKSRSHAKAASDKAKVVDPIEVDARGRPMQEVHAEAEKAAETERANQAKGGKTAQPFRANIPDNWKAMPEDQQRTLAARLTATQVNSKADAEAAIEAEVKRRQSV